MRLLMTCAAITSLLLCASARAVVLYQGSGSATPESQGWLTYIGGPNSTHVSAGGVTTLNTTANNSDQSGWGRNFGNPSWPTMDRSGNGYTVSLDMKILSQSTTNNDRAGISLIAISSDLLGIEIAFFGNEVWAYDFTAPTTFTHGEGAAFNTMAASTTYDVAIHGTTYQVFANGNSILTGPLRNYSPRGLVYAIPNFISVGDDTSESNGSFEFSRLEVNANVPEPATIGALTVGLLSLRRRRQMRG